MAAREYKTVVVKATQGFLPSGYKPADIAGVLNREALEGWKLAQAVPGWLGSWDTFLVILERERTQG